jgi:signal peptide peptidase SppA
MLNAHGDVAVLQVYGSLVPKESWMNRYFGMVSYEEIRNAAISAAESGARAVLLDFDTGGGAVSGIGELSDFLRDFSNNVAPVYSYTGANMLSAGYWLGAVGKKVFSSDMALSGSIGVISSHFSYARMLKEQGIDVTMFRKGEFKALGSPYEQLDDKAKADIEARLGGYYDKFLAHVSQGRGIAVPTLIETAAEGRVFMGDDAIKVGLVDVVTSFDKALASIQSEIGDRKPRIAVPTHSTSMAGNDMKRKLNDAGLAAVASGVDQAMAIVDPKLSEEVTEETVVEQPAEVAPAEAAPEGDEEDGAKAEDKPKVQAEQPKSSGNDSAMIDRLIELTAKLTTAEAELAALKTADATRDTQFKALMKIAVDSVNRMELPLGRTVSDLKSADASTVLSTYQNVISAFNSQFKVGGVSEVPAADNLGTKPAESLANLSPSLAAL